jgi:hypothetical protein
MFADKAQAKVRLPHILGDEMVCSKMLMCGCGDGTRQADKCG